MCMDVQCSSVSPSLWPHSVVAFVRFTRLTCHSSDSDNHDSGLFWLCLFKISVKCPLICVSWVAECKWLRITGSGVLMGGALAWKSTTSDQIWWTLMGCLVCLFTEKMVWCSKQMWEQILERFRKVQFKHIVGWRKIVRLKLLLASISGLFYRFIILWCKQSVGILTENDKPAAKYFVIWSDTVANYRMNLIQTKRPGTQGQIWLTYMKRFLCFVFGCLFCWGHGVCSSGFI